MSCAGLPPNQMPIAKPQRMRLSRRAGFDLQRESFKLNGLPAVNCARPGRFGNPYVIGKKIVSDNPKLNGIIVKDNSHAVQLFEQSLSEENCTAGGFAMLTKIPELRGKNLACYCRLEEKCHCDVLLKIANA